MFRVEIDAGQVAAKLGQVPEQIMPLLQKGASALAAQTHAHVIQQVQEKLKSTREKYLSALHFSQVNDHTWLVSLEKEAFWIEDGIEPGREMIDDLLKARPGKGPVKTAADGSRFRVIPFQHNKAPTRTWDPALALQETVKKELKNRGIPYGKIESDSSGAPKVGLLHKFDIMNAPLKTHKGPGQGWGLPNEVRKGPTGIPFLQGVRVYQNLVKDKDGNQVLDKMGQPKVSRQIMTFRIVSSKHKGTGRWVHPGLTPRKFLDEAYRWANETWENQILPELQKELEGK